MLSRTLFLFTVATAALAACESKSQGPAAPPSAAAEPAVGPATTAGAATPAAAATLTRIEDTSQVCMVNNQFMGKAQIPVEVGGKTYYGCCEMCKERLQKDAAARTAIDPVTGATVDKATAVIARDASGTAYYFASADNLARYRGPAAGQPAPAAAGSDGEAHTH